MTLQSTTPTSKPSFKTSIFVFGGFQLTLGLVLGSWTWTIWQRAEGDLPAIFWGALALTLFLFGIAQINLVGPFRDWGYRLPERKIALAYRLEPLFGGTALTWPFLSVAFAFGMPVVPMILFLLNVEGPMTELNLIWIVLTLMGVIVGGVTLFLGLQKLYQRLNGSQTVVEASAETVKPGERLSLLVLYIPGRLVPDTIQVKLVCQKTVMRSRGGTSGKTTETKVIFEADIQPNVKIDSAIWQKSLSAILPEDAPLSTDPKQNGSITWGIDVIAHIPNAPDIAETFVFTVDDPELRVRWEAEWEAEVEEIDYRPTNGT
jgi:hypothetical protein